MRRETRHFCIAADQTLIGNDTFSVDAGMQAAKNLLAEVCAIPHLKSEMWGTRTTHGFNMIVMKQPSLLLTLVVAYAASLTAQSWRADRAKLCFVRPENSGMINGLISYIEVENYRLPLIGDEAACVFVDSRDIELVVTSTLPTEQDSPNEKACRSPTVKLHLGANDTRTFFVYPGTKDSEYTCAWRIVQALASNRPLRTR